ncbi:MAG TPA: pyridoxamine 5'-phosphate oxidase family protein [Candidatus Paceibacterota bacterium]
MQKTFSVNNPSIELSSKITDALLQAESKALATIGNDGINVVPVSTVRVKDGKILLMNYFFKKTLENILNHPSIALTFWSGLEGYQIKGSVEYKENGPDFEEANQWINDNVADRVLLGLLIITPEKLFNISPGAN